MRWHTWYLQSAYLLACFNSCLAHRVLEQQVAKISHRIALQLHQADGSESMQDFRSVQVSSSLALHTAQSCRACSTGYLP